MRIELIDRIGFYIISKVCVKQLTEEHPEWDGRAIKHIAKRQFKQMLHDTPSIGTHLQNCMKMNMTGGAVWFAIYDAVEQLYGRMSDEQFERMCHATFTMPLMVKRMKRMPFFNANFQTKYAKKLDKVNRIRSPYNWTAEYNTGAPDSFSIRFTTCGLCAFAKQTGHMHILPVLCQSDYTVAAMIGVNLHRDKTLASGDPVCDYLYTRPCSEVEKQWQAEHPEGTFHSK